MRAIKLGILIGTSCFALAAYAQSSVTLYGLIDAGVAYSNNQKGGSAFQAVSGKHSGSRWGIKGAEDLGGGTKAIFQLENGFSVMNGTMNQGGRLFGRQAYVGLSNDTFGTVTFGRQYDSLNDELCQIFAPCFFTPATHIGDLDNLNQSFRINNSVKYQSPNFGGLTFNGVYGFSNQSNAGDGTGFSNNRAWSFAASYANSGLLLGGGLIYLDHPNSSLNTSGAVGGSSTSGDDYSGGLFNALDQGVARQIIAVGGASYKLANLTVGGGLSRVLLDYNDGAARKFSNYDFNVRYQPTAPVYLLLDYTYTTATMTGLANTGGATLKPKWHQVTLGAEYWLSKRTDLYLAAEYQQAAGDGSTLVNGQYTQIAQIKSVGTSSSTNKQVGVELGIRHRF